MKTLNSRRDSVINEVDKLLTLWRDNDDRTYLHAAYELIQKEIQHDRP